MSQIDNRLESITKNFNLNIQALIIFAEKIGDFADQHDRKIEDQIEKSIIKVSSTLDAIIDNYQVCQENETSDEKFSTSSILSSFSQTQKRELAQEIIAVVFENRRLIRHAKRTYINTPLIQGILLRNSALISLMSILETLIAQLLREFYCRYPAALPSESKSLSLAELRNLGSIEEAELYLIDNEIDSILRGSIQHQLSCFEKPVKISLKPIERYVEELIETSQRRNLLVHNDGKINRHYLNRTPSNLIDSNTKEGDQI